ncbi:hypothetical protein DPSP01_004029 [Paraphaeosphaeria sporulosa]
MLQQHPRVESARDRTGFAGVEDIPGKTPVMCQMVMFCERNERGRHSDQAISRGNIPSCNQRRRMAMINMSRCARVAFRPDNGFLETTESKSLRHPNGVDRHGGIVIAFELT